MLGYMQPLFKSGRRSFLLGRLSMTTSSPAKHIWGGGWGAHLLLFAESHPHLKPPEEEFNHFIVLRFKGWPVHLKACLAVMMDEHCREETRHYPQLQGNVAGTEQVREPDGSGEAEAQVGTAVEDGEKQLEGIGEAAVGLGAGGGEELRKGHRARAEAVSTQIGTEEQPERVTERETRVKESG